jgi:hypothetical protein
LILTDTYAALGARDLRIEGERLTLGGMISCTGLRVEDRKSSHTCRGLRE